jgi:hypothetical protein
MKYVSQAIELSRRHDNLSWGHHQEVAALPDATQQDYWLDRAEKASLSARDLRDMVRPKPETPQSEEIQRLREWLKQNCPTVQAYVQNSVYDVVERLKTGDVEKFDLEVRLASAEEVKAACVCLAQQETHVAS